MSTAGQFKPTQLVSVYRELDPAGGIRWAVDGPARAREWLPHGCMSWALRLVAVDEAAGVAIGANGRGMLEEVPIHAIGGLNDDPSPEERRRRRAADEELLRRARYEHDHYQGQTWCHHCGDLPRRA